MNLKFVGMNEKKKKNINDSVRKIILETKPAILRLI